MKKITRRRLFKGLMALTPLLFVPAKTRADHDGFVMVDGWILKRSDLELLSLGNRTPHKSLSKK